MKPIVYIEWVDSHQVNGWTHTSDLAREVEPEPIISVGFLLDESESAVRVAGHYGPGDRNEQACGVMTIPRVAITAFRLLVPPEELSETDSAKPADKAVAKIVRDSRRSKKAMLANGEALAARQAAS